MQQATSQKLQCLRPTKGRILGAEHLPHAALAQLGDDLAVAGSLAAQDRFCLDPLPTDVENSRIVPSVADSSQKPMAARSLLKTGLSCHAPGTPPRAAGRSSSATRQVRIEEIRVNSRRPAALEGSRGYC